METTEKCHLSIISRKPFDMLLGDARNEFYTDTQDLSCRSSGRYNTSMEEREMGAGVIPFAVNGHKVNFLFQKTFTGRKVGYLIDFGGGLGAGEDHRETAIREFVEETETMYFADDVQQASRSGERVNKQIPVVECLFAETLEAHPDWWCRRTPGNPIRPKRWKTFFIEFPYRDVDELNREWESDTVGRFKKRRELLWIPANELLAIYENAPDRLWKRVRQLENASETIRSIQREKGF